MAKAQSPFLFCLDRGQSEQPEDLSVIHEEIKVLLSVRLLNALNAIKRQTLNLVANELMLELRMVIKWLKS